MRTHEARSYPCVLVQSLPSASRVASWAGAGRSFYNPAHARTARDLYGIAIRITHIDRAIIRGYLDEYSCARTTSRAPEKTPDPGLRMQWLPDDELPFGLQTQLLPRDLERKLSALPTGFERVLIDKDVLLVDTATRTIVDVMRNACATGDLERCAARKRDHARPSINRHGRAVTDKAAGWRLYDHVAML